MPEPTKESGWQILRAEADDLRRKLKNVHEGRERAIERARVAESRNTRYVSALERISEPGAMVDAGSYKRMMNLPDARDIAREALAPDAGTEER